MSNERIPPETTNLEGIADDVGRTGGDLPGLAAMEIGPLDRRKMFGESSDRGPVKIGHVAALIVARLKGD